MGSSIVVSFVSLFAFLVFLLGICIFRASRKEHAMAKNVIYLLIAIIAAIVIQCILLFVPNEKTAVIVNSLFFVNVDLIRLLALIITVEFTGYVFRHEKAYLMIKLVTAMDCLLMIVNIYTGQVFTCVKMQLGDIYYYKVDIEPFFTVHALIAYATIGFILFMIYKKVASLSIEYWTKYIALGVTFSIAVIVNIVYLFSNYAVDISVVSYALAGMAAHYMILEHRFLVIVDRLLSYVLFLSGDAIILLDADGNCIYLNQQAKTSFEVENDDYSMVMPKMEKLLSMSDIDMDKNEYSALCSLDVYGKLKHYEVLYKRMLRKEKLVGSYYRIKDRTIEVEVFNKDKYKATHDKLTGLYNGDYFGEKAEEILRSNPTTQYYIICLDIKDFKLVNDAFGKKVGDRVLNAIAWKIREKTAKDAIYCRLSGDKFCIFTEKKKFDEEEFGNATKEISVLDGVNYPLTIHIGIYKVENRKLSVSAMIDRAFMAIDENKEAYNNKIFYYDDTIRESRYWEQRLSGELEDAIRNNQLKVFLQSQCDATGKVYGAEALVRWLHPKEGMIPPYRFIPMFEQNGLISKVDLFVWETAVKLLRKWKDEGVDDYYISVNISPADFYFLDIIKEFTELVTRYDVDPGKLKLEITETVMMSDLESRLLIVEKLQKFGFTVEMDDFGSGFSSLNMLKDISVDILKLDMKFLYKAKDDEKSKKILKMIVLLSKSLGMPVICEGVETEEQLEFLKSIDCDFFQGYYFSKPVPVEEFEEQNLRS